MPVSTVTLVGQLRRLEVTPESMHQAADAIERLERDLAARDAWIERAREALNGCLGGYPAISEVAMRALLATTPEPASVHTGQAGHTGFVIERNEP